MNTQNRILRIDRAREWRAKSAILVMGWLLYETLTGLAIYLLPFSLSTQFMVIVHTVVGLVFIIPFAWYQIRHWLNYRRQTMNHIKLTGYLVMFMLVICILSGIVLTAQALFSIKINTVWDTIHIISTFAIIIFTLPHIFALILQDRNHTDRNKNTEVQRAERIFGYGTIIVTAVLFAITAMWIYAFEPVEFQNEFPTDYNFIHGKDQPFLPSLAQTTTGGAIDGLSLAGSRSCGSAGCHEEILKEWESSAHRYSALDAAFQTVQKVMGQQNGPESTRYCGGCHDPISLFSGTKNIFVEDLTALYGYQEGISCLVCHAIKETDVKGNAAYTISQTERYAFELKEGRVAKILNDFLIRAYPRYHVNSLSKRLFKSPEFCAACHKQFIDEEINKVGWVQLQNQYDNWRKSRWNQDKDPTKTIECRECHMPLVADSQDPARGDALDYNRSVNDGKHRSHRFLGANQFMPILHDLPGGKEHTELIEKWLRGEIEIPEISDKWSKGPAIPIELNLPERVTPGDIIDIKVNITNNKAGHDFPTGPLDIIQAWIEILVKDDDGNIIFQSGIRDDQNFIQPGTFMFKAEAVDQYGNLIDRHNLWEMVGVRYRRTLFPGFSDLAEYSFNCAANLPTRDRNSLTDKSFQFNAPSMENSTLHVEAYLQYRKIDQYLLNFLYGEDTNLTSPVTTVSEDSGKILVMR